MSRIPIRVASPTKYYSRRTDDGYASKREAKRAAELRLLQSGREIFDLQEQVRIELLPACPSLGYRRAVEYWADFQYKDDLGILHTEDAKGYPTAVYKLKKRLLAQLKGIIIEEV